MPHLSFRLVLAALLACGAARPGAAQDRLALQLFSEIDREAVAQGETLWLTVEALATPTDADDAQALAAAFGGWDLARQLGPGFEVVRSVLDGSRVTGEVVEHRRRVLVQVTDGGVAEVPALRLDIAMNGRTVSQSTRSHPIRTFAASEAVATAARSVVSVTAEGELDGVAFERRGSAFAIGGDALVTAYHVVVGAHRVRVRLPDGREASIDRAWTLDPERDVAVLHLDAETAVRSGLRPLVLAPEGAGGSVSFTAGWPGPDQRSTVAPRYADLDLDGQRVRMAANAVSPGDSGGPLLDGAGRVLGVVVSGRGETGSPDLLRESICLAADLSPALARYRQSEAALPLRWALAAAETEPAGLAHAAAGTMGLVGTRSAIDRAVQVELLRDALRRASDDAVLLFLTATALEQAGDPLAAGAFDAARRGGYLPAGYALGYHLLEHGRLRAAADVFAETARDGAYRRLASFGQAKALVEMGRYTEAEVALTTVLDHDSRFAPALYLLGIVRLSQGRDAEARALAVRLSEHPAWAEALRLTIVTEAFRPPVVEPLPRVALR